MRNLAVHPLYGAQQNMKKSKKGGDTVLWYERVNIVIHKDCDRQMILIYLNPWLI